jgi:peptidoglycan/LPS O-acetylase OafA/YrhL
MQINDNFKRLAFLDNLRVVLVVFVLMSHLAITYGPIGIWYYYERIGLASTYILAFFLSFMQAFLMGLFFLISGYLTPYSFKKKGANLFLTDRLRRLGIPLLFYVVVLSPILLYLHETIIVGNQINFFQFFFHEIIRKQHIDIGPLWFVQALLFFSLFYAIIDSLLKKISIKKNVCLIFPSDLTILKIILIFSLFIFVFRIRFPIGAAVSNLQIGLSPQYVFLYFIGVISYQNNWIEYLTQKKAQLWLIYSITVVVIWTLTLLTSGDLNENIALLAGGLNWQSYLYSFWEASLSISMPIVLLYYFKEKCNTKNHFMNLLGKNTYAFFIIHTPIIVLLAYSFRNVAMHPLLKFISITASGTFISFFISFFLTKIPFLKRIL